MTATTYQSRLIRNIRLVAWLNLFLGMRFHVAFAPVYYAHVTGSLTKATIVLATGFVSAALFEVPTGVISDRIGRRMTSAGGAFASLVSVALYAWGASFFVLLLGAVAEGLRRALVSGNNEALLFESVKGASAGTYASHLGRTESYLELTLALSAPAGSLVAAWNMHAAVALGLIPQMLCVLTALRITEPQHEHEHVGNNFAHLREAVRAFRTSARLRWLTLASAVNYGFGEAGYLFRPAVVATMWPLWAIGIVQFIGNLGTAVSSWFAGPVINRFGAVKGVIASSAFQRIISILALVRPTSASPLLLGVIGFGYGVRNVGERALLQNEFTDEQRATMASLVSLLGSIVLALALVGMGVVADALNPGTSMLIGQLILIVPTLIYLGIFVRGRRPVQR